MKMLQIVIEIVVVVALGRLWRLGSLCFLLDCNQRIECGIVLLEFVLFRYMSSVSRSLGISESVCKGSARSCHDGMAVSCPTAELPVRSFRVRRASVCGARARDHLITSSSSLGSSTIIAGWSEFPGTNDSSGVPESLLCVDLRRRDGASDSTFGRVRVLLRAGGASGSGVPGSVSGCRDAELPVNDRRLGAADLMDSVDGLDGSYSFFVSVSCKFLNVSPGTSGYFFWPSWNSVWSKSQCGASKKSLNLISLRRKARVVRSKTPEPSS